MSTLRACVMASLCACLLSSCNGTPATFSPDTLQVVTLLSDGSVWLSRLNSGSPGSATWINVSQSVTPSLRFNSIDCDAATGGPLHIVASHDRDISHCQSTSATAFSSFSAVGLPGLSTPQAFRDVTCAVNNNGSLVIVATELSAGNFEPGFVIRQAAGGFTTPSWIHVNANAHPNFMNGIAVANDSGTLRFVGIDSITGVSRADHTGAGWSAYTSIAGASGVSPSIIIASGGVNIFGQLNGSIWHSFSGSAGLSDVHALGATSSGGFTMIDAAMAPNNLHLVGIRNGALMHSSRQISGTSWTPFVAFPGPSPAISIVDVAVTRAD